MTTIIITDGSTRLAKYHGSARFSLQQLVDPASTLKLPPSQAATTTSQAYSSLVNASIAKSTWGKYQSAMKAFSCFEAAHCTSFNWPLTKETCRAFATWCHSARHLQPSSIKGYLAGLKFVHLLKGMNGDHLTGDPIIHLILKGSFNASLQNPLTSSTRRVVTFPLLLTIGHRIAASAWDPLAKQVVFTACTTGFFASTRMGEILACEEDNFDITSNLTWADIHLTEGDSILIRLKQPKSGEKEGEFVDLFRFPGYHCCPVKAFKLLASLQAKAGVYGQNLPVFRFASGKNLTTSHLNRVLADLLDDICCPGVSTISCHSFRAGIPSTISTFPDLATSDLIKGWGRWKSDCYQSYTRLKLPQRANIFAQIAQALHTVSTNST